MEDAVAQLSSWRQCPSRLLQGKIHSEIVVVGLRESGKSALVNALFSEEVSQEREASSKSVKGGDKHVISYKGNTLAVWDTCGFLEHGNPENEDAFKAIEAIPCMKENKCSALVVTIAIAKIREKLQRHRRYEKAEGNVWCRYLGKFAYSTDSSKSSL